jgi:hypothetical protein
MRLLTDKRGQVRVIEAFFASILLLSCLALIPAPSSEIKDSSINLASTAQNVLLSLDNDGHLANAVAGGNWQSIKNGLESVLPLNVWFNLTVMDKNLICLNPYPICNAGSVSDKVYSLDYVCVGQSGTFAVYILRLQLSLVD